MNITILDDYQDCVRHLNCFSSIAQHNVRIFNDTVKGVDALAERLADADAVVLMRQRTAIKKELLDRLPKLRMLSQTGAIGAHVDLPACSERGIVVMAGKGDGSTTAELTWALML
ncbi:MAG TPA: D-2-hydroxyacid dehydrogenase family protein, partial [Paralcaligenes sp.]